MIKLKSLLIISILFISGCGANRAQQSEENLKRLDALYGYCDNPQRNINSGLEYEICKSKERANQGEPLNAEDIATSIQDLFGGDKISNGVSYSTVNPYLWQASLKVLSPFSIKIADNGGGYIETDWILDYNQSQDARCQIKTIIMSPELVSNGVEVKINCQNFDGENWLGDQKNYIEEEKDLTIKILQTATTLQS